MTNVSVNSKPERHPRGILFERANSPPFWNKESAKHITPRQKILKPHPQRIKNSPENSILTDGIFTIILAISVKQREFSMLTMERFSDSKPDPCGKGNRGKPDLPSNENVQILKSLPGDVQAWN